MILTTQEMTQWTIFFYIHYSKVNVCELISENLKMIYLKQNKCCSVCG